MTTWQVSVLCLLSMSAIDAVAEESEPEAVDIALIEFLGSFTTEDGEWVDPLGMLGDDAYLDTALAAEDAEGDDDEQDN